MELIMAGYISAPLERAGARSYYEELVKIPAATGLELSWTGPETGAELYDLIPDTWLVKLSLIGATMLACQENAAFGLASPDESGRAAAINLVREARDGVHAVNDRLGRRAAIAVELHSAPGFGSRQFVPEARAFGRSLEEVAGMDWDGSAVLVEHCDAFVAGQTPAKGFLSLDEELDVVSSLEGAVGLSLNWGRSVIEGRDPDRAMQHVMRAASSGRLRAYTFSGAAGVATAYGAAWADAHHPFTETGEPGYGEPASLMTPELVEPILGYLDDCLFVAVKTSWPRERQDPAERVRAARANFNTAAAALNRPGRRQDAGTIKSSSDTSTAEAE
jgi:hypothetical protein